MNRNNLLLSIKLIFCTLVLFYSCLSPNRPSEINLLKQGFLNPPDSARPGVYWYFIDGNRDKNEITNDLESMKKSGIASVLMLEVNLGTPQGKVKFMSDEWQDMFLHAINECERLGMQFTLGIGPGWSGSGGPWVKADESMQHLTISSVKVKGPARFKDKLALPKPIEPPFFWIPTEEITKQRDAFYKDVAVLAFPTPKNDSLVDGFFEKALYMRWPYTSFENVDPFIAAPAEYKNLPFEDIIQKKQIVDITDLLKKDGSLEWNIPKGDWTIMRFTARNNGVISRPAPLPGLGFECDKFDTVSLQNHLDQFTGKLMKKINYKKQSCWTTIHLDSWEMGAQNWSDNFRKEFIARRGYDPQPYYPAYSGLVVGSLEETERFLWDLRITSQDLILEYHAKYLKKYAHKYGFNLSIEPYDMTPCSDMELGAIADIPMCEFWQKGKGFQSTFSCLEITSLGLTLGRPVIAAEAFTSLGEKPWKESPASIKNQGDWAFCNGINKFYYHTWVHNSIGETYSPGMTLSICGLRWNNRQPFWPMVDAYHEYIASCQFMLQQGKTQADILFLAGEGAPYVFTPPKSAMTGNDTIPDKKSYNFAACTPSMLLDLAEVKDNKIVFPNEISFHILVLPSFETMTPELLKKIKNMVYAGAAILGNPPLKSPSLVNYPACDEEVKEIAQSIWPSFNIPEKLTEIACGKGKVYWGKEICKESYETYPHYDIISDILKKNDVTPDFVADESIRYIHKKVNDIDVYFVSNRTNKKVELECQFKATKGTPECWDPVIKEIIQLGDYKRSDIQTIVPLSFDAYQSYFIMFNPENNSVPDTGKKNFTEPKEYSAINGTWQVTFKPKYDSSFTTSFDKLYDWTSIDDERIKYFSGIAEYEISVDLSDNFNKNKFEKIFIDLGKVNCIAKIWLNGEDVGTIWTAPWRIEVSKYLQNGKNQLRIDVANLWPNRMIGDERFEQDASYNSLENLLTEWPEWLINKSQRPTARKSFSLFKPYSKDDKLLESGLLGPVKIIVEN